MRKSIKYLSRQETKFLKLCRLPFQKSRKKNKCLGQVKELPYIRSNKFTTKFCHKVLLLPSNMDVYVTLSK